MLLDLASLLSIPQHVKGRYEHMSNADATALYTCYYEWRKVESCRRWCTLLVLGILLDRSYFQ